MDNENVRTAITAPSVSSALISIALVSLACIIIAFKWNRRHLEKLAAQIPGPPGLPIIGNALVLLGTHEEVLRRAIGLVKTYGTVFSGWLGPSLFIIMANPQDIQIVLNSPKSLNKSHLYGTFYPLVGNGLVTAPAEIWRKHKRMITPAFNMRMLEGFVPVFYKHNIALVDKLRPLANNGHFDVLKYISWTALGVILETAFGLDERTPDKLKSEFAESIARLQDILIMRCFKIWLQSDFIFFRSSYGIEAMKNVEKVNHLTNKVIEEKRKEYKLKKEKESERNKDTEPKLKVFIDTLIEQSEEDGTKFTDVELRDEVITMIIAGHDTTAQTICFILLMLAIHQDVQEKVYEEMFGIFGNSDREVTTEDFKQMTYTEMVIKETMRMFPILPAIGRYITEDLDLTNYRIPAGCNVLIIPIILHRDPHIYPKPENFNPENFTQDRIAERHKYSYIPFSQGPRSCLGQVYAMFSMKTSMACLIRNYKFFTDLKMEDIKVKINPLLRFCTGYPIRIVQRKQSEQHD